jgi:hypothetical protein
MRVPIEDSILTGLGPRRRDPFQPPFHVCVIKSNALENLQS